MIDFSVVNTEQCVERKQFTILGILVQSSISQARTCLIQVPSLTVVTISHLILIINLKSKGATTKTVVGGFHNQTFIDFGIF